MALADIIGRIESDAGAEARALTDGAKAKAEALLAEAERHSEHEREHSLKAARHDAEARAATLLANARLAARDEMLAAKRALVERTLSEAVGRLLALDDAAYTRLIARGIVAIAHDGDVISVAAPDAGRLGGLKDAVTTVAADGGRTLDVSFSADTSGIEHGVLVQADRVSAEVSPASMVAGRHNELMALAASVLFPGEGE